MAITIPTVDEFTESTVMLVIREIAEYICGNNGLVAQINNNDITGFTSSYTNNILKIDATKGDGSTIPVCNVTIEGGGSSTGNPYPTGVSGTVGDDGNITFTITMSSGSPLTTTINMNYFASTSDLSDLQEQVTGLKLTSSGNTMSINGTNANIVNSVTGSVSGGNLTIGVNGINSSPIEIGSGGSIQIKKYTDVTLASMLSEWYEDEEEGDTFVFTKVIVDEISHLTATNIIITIVNKKPSSSTTHNYRVITGYLKNTSTQKILTPLTDAYNMENNLNFSINYLDTQDNSVGITNINTNSIISGVLYRIR